jgi:hypothetical protein
LESLDNNLKFEIKFLFNPSWAKYKIKFKLT